MKTDLQAVDAKTYTIQPPHQTRVYNTGFKNGVRKQTYG